MSAKARFMQRLRQSQRPASVGENRQEADIAEFRLRMAQLRQSVEGWLDGAGVSVEETAGALTDLLVSRRDVDIPGIRLRYSGRTMDFTPLYLYGHGVTGCVDITLRTEGRVTPLLRLFMRAGPHDGWCCQPALSPSRPVTPFTETQFFETAEALLP